MKRLTRWLTSLAINFALAGLFYLWKFHGLDAAGNVVMFWLWLMVIAGILMAFVPPNIQSAPRIRSLERINVAWGVVVLAVLVAFAHFILASFYLLSMLCIAVYRDRLDTSEKRKECA
jgi:uncharacterized membrane protein